VADIARRECPDRNRRRNPAVDGGARRQHAGMRARVRCRLPSLALACLAIVGCTRPPVPDTSTSVSADPQLPLPTRSLLPTVAVGPAAGWSANDAPRAAEGLAVHAFARDLDHPRWLYVLPNGDVLVAETNAPPKPDDGKGIRAYFMKRFMRRAGAGTPSANRITLLRDADVDGVAETRSVFLQDLNSPVGIALVRRTAASAGTAWATRAIAPRSDARGALLVADDVGNAVWRVTSAR
jgi:glucose/arabinose dehydrogenase